MANKDQITTKKTTPLFNPEMISSLSSSSDFLFLQLEHAIIKYKEKNRKNQTFAYFKNNHYIND